jgi:PAS domain S-box-containing protein
MPDLFSARRSILNRTFPNGMFFTIERLQYRGNRAALMAGRRSDKKGGAKARRKPPPVPPAEAAPPTDEARPANDLSEVPVVGMGASAANNDMANLFNCTDIPTLFLDANFRIRRFTAAAAQMFNVIGADVGRPIRDITLKFADPDLLSDAETVLHQLTRREKEVRTEDGRWHLRRAIPYRTVDGRIDGVVMTFTDVTGIKHAAEQARYLATVLLDSDDAIMVHDFHGRITAWNRGAERLYGHTKAEALQMNLQAMMPEAERPVYERITQTLQRGERVDSWESQRLTRDGRIVDVWITATLLTDDAGRPLAIAKTDRDITERKRALTHLEQEVERRTAALQESESRLRAILNAPDDAIITIDHHGIIDSVNPAAERMFGYAAAEMIGQNVKMLMPPPHRQRHDGYLEHYLATNEAHIIGIGREVQARRKDGTTFHVDLAVSEVKPLRLFTGILRDITRRKELEREVVEIAALEQQRIGQDLHDQCGQELTALGLFADTLVNSLKDRSPPDVALAQKITQRAKGVLRQVRGIAKGLALTEVEAANLPDALAELAARLSETSEIRCRFQGEAAICVADNIQATQLYHIAQEACTNALRHADAKNIEIRLDSNDNALTLKICDDGRGIPAEVNAGLGLRIMHNRANVIGAILSIEAAEPHGTAVTCALTPEYSHGKKQS